MNIRKRQWFTVFGMFLALLLLLTLPTFISAADPYPNKPVRLIIPFAPGGSSDIVARIVTQKFAEQLGQPMVPENRPGAGGQIAYSYVSTSKPDGYTIVLCAPSLIIHPSLYKKINYDPIKDFAPISVMVQNTRVVVVRSAFPAKNFKEFVEYARANPGKLNYGTAGIGITSQLAVELLKSLQKIDIMVVQYKSESQALTALLGGETDMQVITPELAAPHIQSGKLKALAVLSKERIPILPDVPTSHEAGIDNLEVNVWYGLLAPAGTPRDIIHRLNAEWIKIASDPETKERLQKGAGYETLSCTPEQFSEALKAEMALWAKVTKQAKIFGIY